LVRAQLTERQKKVERAHSALAWFEIAAAALSLGVAAWIVAEVAGVPNVLARLMAEGWPDFWVGVQSLAAVSPVIFFRRRRWTLRWWQFRWFG
jgi:hypothetical protein